MNHLLERVASFAARRHWIIIVAWLIILGGLVAAANQWGGTYVNNYNVTGTASDNGLNRLNSD